MIAPRRLLTYARERFPLAAYVPMILLASFAALAWSRMARGADGFVGWPAYATVALTLFAAFFTLRVADEHKDAEADRVSRPTLPVPRGLVTLAELRGGAAALVLAAVAANLVLHTALVWPLAAIALWLALMTREFFVPAWLRARPVPYLVSHMVIMPLILLHATAVDWLADGATAPPGIGMFLAATYATGLVLEVGRKIRAPADERPGVDTYTASWGARRAAGVWLIAIALSATTIVLATQPLGGRWTLVAAPVLAVVLAIPGARFALGTRESRHARAVEGASAVWTLLAYPLLALPWIERALR